MSEVLACNTLPSARAEFVKVDLLAIDFRCARRYRPRYERGQGNSTF